MIEHFLDSTLIIDDMEDEAKPLMEELDKQDIWIRYFHPNDLKSRKTPLKSRKLIFLDLHLDEGVDLYNNISIIRGILEVAIGKDFGCYGIILWTKHDEEIEELKKRIAKDGDKYCLPLFILPLPKTKYIKEKSYKDLLLDIDNLLRNNVASNFFVYWDRLVDIGKQHSIQSIYALANNNSYSTLEQDLLFILYNLAKNQTGIPLKYLQGYKLEDDAIKAIADMLHYDIIHQHNNEISLFTSKNGYKYSGDQSFVFAHLNSKLFLNFKGLDTDAVIPGNVYRVLNEEDVYSLKEIPEGAIRVVVEVTPPCDFAMEKKGEFSRVLGGFLVTTNPAHNSKYGKVNFYNFLQGVMIDGYDDPQSFIFDFRYSGIIVEAELKDSQKYKLLCRFKDKLFADILQKSSSHISRLGIPFIK